MRLTYAILSPTFGMHQYTADLANRAARGWFKVAGSSSPDAAGMSEKLASEAVAVITTTTLPRDRYDARVEIHTPITTHGTGFSREGLDIAAYRRALAAIEHRPTSTDRRPSTIDNGPPSIVNRQSSIVNRQSSIVNRQSSIVHFTAVHAWNIPLVHALRRRGIPVVHTLHDLDPHHGVRHAWLIRLWNRLIIASGCHLLVHGQRYRDQLLAAGVPANRVTCTPLLHGFLAADRPWPPETDDRPSTMDNDATPGAIPEGSRDDVQSSIVNRQSSAVLFFGRVEAYKGVDTLLAAWGQISQSPGVNRDNSSNSSNSWQGPRLVIAGPVAKGLSLPPLPPATELRDRRIADAEAEALFRSAGLLVLPYRDATQSALVAAAYAFGVPVIVTAAGALPEYVAGRTDVGATRDGATGWVVPAGDPDALAAALKEALSDPARLRRMGVAGRAWFVARREEEQATLSGMYAALCEL